MTIEANQFAFRGLVLGADTPYFIQSLTGLEDLTARVADRELPRGHGSVPGPHYAAAKDVILDVTVVADGDPSIVNPALLMQRVAELRTAFSVSPTPLPLLWARPGMPDRLIYVAPTQVSRTETVGDRGIFAFLKIALTAADPRIYSSERHQVVVSRYDPAGGSVDYPADYPKDFPAGGATSGVVFNAGASDAYPLLRFYGPKDGGTLTSVTLRNTTTGQALTVATSIGPGQILTVDNAAHVTGAGTPVVSLDGASRYGSWQQPRVPFSLPPGESTLRYETEGTTADTECVVTWRDTWIQ
jgi:hypothetical protein